MQAYTTIREEAHTSFLEKRSEFIGHIKPVTREEEALEWIRSLREEHWKASHNVYAYLLREGNRARYSDDGEPQGTAGMPVLDVLRKEDVTDCVAVVTRYFGGILLGAGGLVRAYTKAAKMALEAGGVQRMRLCVHLSLSCDYAFYGRLSALVPEMGGTLTESLFLDTVEVRFSLPMEWAPAFEKELTESSAGRYQAKRCGESYVPVCD